MHFSDVPKLDPRALDRLRAFSTRIAESIPEDWKSSNDPRDHYDGSDPELWEQLDAIRREMDRKSRDVEVRACDAPPEPEAEARDAHAEPEAGRAPPAGEASGPFAAPSEVKRQHAAEAAAPEPEREHWSNWLCDDLDVVLEDFVGALHPAVADGEAVVLERLEPAFQRRTWGARAAAHVQRNPGSWYACISTMRDARPLKRKKPDSRSMGGFYLDDVGDPEKVPNPPEVMPSCIVETSEGSFQWWYFFDEPYDVSNPDKAAYYDGFFSACAAAGMTDPGAHSVNRIGRVPGSLNLKPGRGEFAARVRLWEPDRRWTSPKELSAELGLDVEIRPEGQPGALQVPAGIRLPGDVHDPVLLWLESNDLVLEDGEDFYEVVCPNKDDHTDGNVTAGFSPLGHGGTERMMHRQFHCFHAHCADFRTASFLRWVAEQGGPSTAHDSPVDLLQLQFAYVDRPQGAVDLTSTIHDDLTPQPIHQFEKRFAQQVPVGRGNQFKGLGRLWVEHPRRFGFDGVAYRPGVGVRIEENGRTYFNQYRYPLHPEAKEEPSWFIDHVRYLCPRQEDQELVLDWLACKVQHPEWRSFAILMVAERSIIDVIADGGGTSFGVGRSMLIKALKGVFQAGVRSVKFKELLEIGHQSQYNEYLLGAQVIGADEVKVPEADSGERASHYEVLKKLIDNDPDEDHRIKLKYGGVYTGLWCNFLFFTNHGDAIPLPPDDRRFYVIENPARLRSAAEYAEFRERARDPQSCADLFWWLMNRRVDRESDRLIHPPMTAAKERMIERTEVMSEDVVLEVLRDLPGDVVTLDLLAAHCEDAHPGGATHRYVKRVFNRLPPLERGDKNSSRIRLPGGRRAKVRALRDVERWRRAYADDRELVAEELRKNSLPDRAGALSRLRR